MMTKSWVDLRVVLVFPLVCIVGLCEEKVFFPIRVVDNPIMMQNSPMIHAAPLKASVPPANFSGPPVFSHLLGRCFKLIDGNYRYELCPFHNMTQHEETSSWNAYHGVIGTWRGWIIQDGHFTGMLMDGGDECGRGRRRQAHVWFGCGPAGRLTAVREAVTCSYVANLTSPLACLPDALRVYPALDPPLRQRWDSAAAMRARDLLSDRGYAAELHRIFVDAGLVPSLSEHERGAPRCEDEMRALKQELQTLRRQNRRLKKLLEEVRGKKGTPSRSTAL